MKTNAHTLPDTVILVRHGEYRDGPTEPLTPAGREHIRMLAERLRGRIDLGAPLTVVASPVGRAYDSADILSSLLDHDRDPERLDALKTTAGYIGKEQTDAIIERIRRSRERTLILVGHLELLQDFPWHLGVALGMNLHGDDYGKAAALVIDMRTGRSEVVRWSDP